MDIFPDFKDLKKRTPKPTERELILRFFIQQQSSGFKEGWLYYKCQNEGLLDEFKRFQKEGAFKLLETIRSTYPEPKLTIELVPQTCWFSNVRSNITNAEWTRLKKITAHNAGYKCEVCGGKGDKWPVECHEIWDYNDNHLTQTLIGLIALCPSCHSAKHMGFTGLCGRDVEITCHLALVNGWSYHHAREYVEKQFEIWRERSKYHWLLDISWLSHLNISINNQERLDNHYTNLSENERQYYISNRKKAADAFYLGADFERKKDFEKAFLCYKESSEYGDPDSTYNLAIFYFKGLYEEVNHIKAWEYIEKAAFFGDKTSLRWLEPEIRNEIDQQFIDENKAMNHLPSDIVSPASLTPINFSAKTTIALADSGIHTSETLIAAIEKKPIEPNPIRVSMFALLGKKIRNIFFKLNFYKIH